MGRNTVSIVVVGIVSMFIYLVYTGSYNFSELLLAFITGFLVAYVFGGELVSSPSKIGLRRLLYAIAYVVKYFTVIEARAHYSVVKAILSRKPDLKPAIVRIPYSVDSEYSIVSIANSITNTPGTVVVDVDEDKKQFYVHWLFTVSTEDKVAWKHVSKEFEEWARKIFE